MRTNSLLALALAAGAVLLGAAPATAQQTKGKSPLSATVDLGFVNTAGNTEVTTLNGGEKIAYTMARWGVTQSFSVVYGQTSGVTTASQWKAGLRGDRTLAGSTSVYVLGHFERNTFAGVKWYFQESAGLGFTVVEDSTNVLKAQLGASYIQQRSVADSTASFIAARAAADYRYNITSSAYAQQAVELLPNLQDRNDLRVNSETALVAPISQHIALKLAYVVRFDNQPEPGYKKTDRTFTSGLQIAF